MEAGNSSGEQYNLLRESLLEPPSTPDAAHDDDGNDDDHAAGINDSRPTPLRYFFSDHNNSNDVTRQELLSEQQQVNEDDDESIETIVRETQLQFVSLRMLGKPFPHTFWFRDWPMAAVLGIVLGLATLCLLMAVHGTLDLWFTINPEDTVAAAVPGGKPKWAWLLVTSIGGLLCGIIMLIPQATSVGTVRTMFHDAIDLKGYPAQALFTVLASFVCLATGAPLGPELAISAMGSGLSSFVAKRLKVNRRTEAAWVLSGMAASLGGLFPSPILGVTLLHELSVAGRPHRGMTLDAIVARDCSNQETVEVVHDHDFMEQVTLAGTASIVAYLVLHALLPQNLPWGQVFEIGNDYQTWHLTAAIPLGVVCGLVASLALVLLGAFRTIRTKVCLVLEETLGAPKWIGRLFFPTLAGALHGLLAISNPYLVGSGMSFVVYLIQNRDSIKVGWLVLMAFCKVVSMSLSLGLGLVGGRLFPMVFVGLSIGLAFSSILPVSLAVPCCMCSTLMFVPIPFTLVFYVAMTLSLTVQQIMPIFVSMFVAYAITGGSGIIRRFGERRLGMALAAENDLLVFDDDDIPSSDQSLLRGIRNTIFGGG